MQLKPNHWLGFWLGITVSGLLLLIQPPSTLSHQAWSVLALAALMVVWWASEVWPFAYTALLPLAWLPLAGVSDFITVARSYCHPIIGLFFGGFVLALAIQKWHLHQRIALSIVLKIGTSTRSLIAAFMLASGFFSMWVTNTATTMMLLPVGLAVTRLMRTEASLSHTDFAAGIMLAIAYASTIGGMATIIGTAPNAIAVGFLASHYHIDLSFAAWFVIGFPLACLGLLFCYWVLTRIALRLPQQPLPQNRSMISASLRALGILSYEEKRVVIIFLCTVSLWITRPLLIPWVPWLSDSLIALLAAALLLLVPASQGRLVSILDLRQIPWGILLLIGGGMALAGGIQQSGIADWLGAQLFELAYWPLSGFMLVAILLVVTLSELASNTATIAAFIPVLGALAHHWQINPLIIVLPLTFAASCAFMLPVATPPNAIVYSTRAIKMTLMMRVGFLLNMIFVLLLTMLAVGLHWFFQ